MRAPAGTGSTPMDVCLALFLSARSPSALIISWPFTVIIIVIIVIVSSSLSLFGGLARVSIPRAPPPPSVLFVRFRVSLSGRFDPNLALFLRLFLVDLREIAGPSFKS